MHLLDTTFTAYDILAGKRQSLMSKIRGVHMCVYCTGVGLLFVAVE